jgi:ABC-type phosphate/phosphonate transport system ATPase subunit
VMRIFQELNEERGITIIFVTHEPDIAEHTRRIVRLQDGLVVSDNPVRRPRRASERAYTRSARDLTNGNGQDAVSPGIALATEQLHTSDHSAFRSV